MENNGAMKAKLKNIVDDLQKDMIKRDIKQKLTLNFMNLITKEIIEEWPIRFYKPDDLLDNEIWNEWSSFQMEMFDRLSNKIYIIKEELPKQCIVFVLKD
jgi:hypothetical protein